MTITSDTFDRDEPADPFTTLNAMQQMAVDLSATGMNAEEVGAAVHRSSRTIRRWKEIPEFQAAYNAKLRERQDSLVALQLETERLAMKNIHREIERGNVAVSVSYTRMIYRPYVHRVQIGPDSPEEIINKIVEDRINEILAETKRDALAEQVIRERFNLPYDPDGFRDAVIVKRRADTDTPEPRREVPDDPEVDEPIDINALEYRSEVFVATHDTALSLEDRSPSDIGVDGAADVLGLTDVELDFLLENLADLGNTDAGPWRINVDEPLLEIDNPSDQSDVTQIRPRLLTELAALQDDQIGIVARNWSLDTDYLASLGDVITSMILQDLRGFARRLPDNAQAFLWMGVAPHPNAPDPNAPDRRTE